MDPAGISNIPTSEWPLDFHILNIMDPFAHTVPSQLQNFQSYRFNSLIALSPWKVLTRMVRAMMFHDKSSR